MDFRPISSAGMTRRDTVLAIAIATPILCWPAVANGFPLIFPDTGPYLGPAYANAWPFDRSGFYGIAIAPPLKLVDGVAGLWLAMLLQVAAVAAVLVFSLRKLGIGLLPQLAIIAVVATLTSLPWHSAQLAPDALTGIVVLLTWLAVSRDPRAPGSPLLWFAAVAAAITHVTHIGIMAVAAAATLIVYGFSGWRIGSRLLASIVALAMVAGIQMAGNGVTLGRWAISPAGPVFLFARMNEDGIIPRWAERHCGRDAPPELCRLQAAMPRDSQPALWNRRSPINRSVWFGQNRWHWVSMMGQANRQAIIEQPLAFAAAAARGGANQFVSFGTLDDDCPWPCADPNYILVHTIQTHRPEILPALERSAQFRDTLPKEAIRAATFPLTVAGLVFLLPMLLLAWRRKDVALLALLSSVALALVANAAMTGALSDVHDRYQSRLVWLAPFVVIAALLSRGNSSLGTPRRDVDPASET